MLTFCCFRYGEDVQKIRYWHPLAPNRVSVFDLGDWVFHSSHEDVTIARKGSETLFWVYELGRGIRCDLEAERAWLASGAVFFTSEGTVYVLPLLLSAHGATTTQLPERVPLDVPFVSARKVYTVRSGNQFEVWPITKQVEPHVLPPLLRLDGQLMYMC